jgi:hypothetical protein
MRIVISDTPSRPKPKVGDIKVVKGITYVRKFRMAHDAFGRVIGYDCTGGRQNYDWVKSDETS